MEDAAMLMRMGFGSDIEVLLEKAFHRIADTLMMQVRDVSPFPPPLHWLANGV